MCYLNLRIHVFFCSSWIWLSYILKYFLSLVLLWLVFLISLFMSVNLVFISFICFSLCVLQSGFLFSESLLFTSFSDLCGSARDSQFHFHDSWHHQTNRKFIQSKKFSQEVTLPACGVCFKRTDTDHWFFFPNKCFKISYLFNFTINVLCKSLNESMNPFPYGNAKIPANDLLELTL